MQGQKEWEGAQRLLYYMRPTKRKDGVDVDLDSNKLLKNYAKISLFLCVFEILHNKNFKKLGDDH